MIHYHKYVCVLLQTIIVYFFFLSISHAETPNELVPQNITYAYLTLNQTTFSTYLITDNEDIVEQIAPLPPSKVPFVYEGMPKNTRQLNEGYWIGAMPKLENIEPMYNHGIRIIVTLAKTKPSWQVVRRKIESLNIEHLYLPIGSRFPQSTIIYNILSQYSPNEVFIHCEHGSDRSGTFIASLLIRNFHWQPQRALLAMLNPANIDLVGLKQVLNQNGYIITDEDLRYRGVYSGHSGLKARNADYKRLISTLLSGIKDYP